MSSSISRLARFALGFVVAGSVALWIGCARSSDEGRARPHAALSRGGGPIHALLRSALARLKEFHRLWGAAEVEAWRGGGEPLIFGVPPYLPKPDLEARFRPLTEHLSRSLERPVWLRIAADYEEHVAFLGEDKLDLAFIGPAALLRVLEVYGPKPILARLEVDHAGDFYGVIFARKTRSDLDSLQSLRGRRFAFGSYHSTMSYLVPVYMLYRAGIELSDLSDYAYLNSHSNVIQAVMFGDFDAGAVKLDVFNQYADRLKVIQVSPPISEYAFVTSIKNQDVSDEIRRVLLNMSNFEDEIKILENINPKVTGILPTSESNYDELKKITAILKEKSLF